MALENGLKRAGMAESTPPPDPRVGLVVKRPWYLVLALSLALFLGATSTMQGCQTFAVYQGALTSDPLVESIPTEIGRKTVEASFQHYIEVVYAAKDRLFPLSVAGWVLGIALMAFTLRALAGSRVARGYLLQVLAAKGVLMVAEFWLTRDVARAEVEHALTRQTALFPDAASTPAPFDPVRFLVFALGAWLVVKLAGVVAMLLALTRQRTKAFYDAVALAERNSSP